MNRYRSPLTRLRAGLGSRHAQPFGEHRGTGATSADTTGAPAFGPRAPKLALATALTLGLATLTYLLAANPQPATAQGDSCPNAEFRTGPSRNLPDCRAYEQVSPVEKSGFDAGLWVDGGGNPRVSGAQAATDGDAITYTSKGALGDAEGAGVPFVPQILSRRGEGGWSTRTISPRFDGTTSPPATNPDNDFWGFTDDLSKGIVRTVATPTPPLTPDATADAPNYYLADLRDRSYELLFPGFSGPLATSGHAQMRAAVHSDDLTHIALNFKPSLLTAMNVHEGFIDADGEAQQREVSIDPSGVPFNGATVGALRQFSASGDTNNTPTAMSADGSRVLFGSPASVGVLRPDSNPSDLYLRDTDPAGGGPATTTWVSEPEPGVPADPTSPRLDAFWDASADASKVFLTSGERLTDDSTADPTTGSFGDLYIYDHEAGDLRDISTDSFTGSAALGRANLDGSGADRSFLPAEAKGVAVDSNHIYWADPDADAIGRANLDGTGADESFITGADNPQYVAVDGSHVYWTNGADGANGNGSIGRANLDGSGADQGFITGANNPQGIAVDSSHIYWANQGSTAATRRIARANLDGTGVDQSFTAAGFSPGPGVAVDSSFIYYTRSGLVDHIRRTNLDGTGDTLLNSGASSPQGIAVDSGHIYWANAGTGSIARANIDGSGANQNFITGAKPQGIAVDSGHIYWSFVDDSTGGRVLGVVRVSPSGEDAYFVAQGRLGTGEGTDGEPNLFHWSDGPGNGELTHIATLAPETADFRTSDYGVYLPGGFDRFARVTPDGRYLAFESRAPLAGDDADVYLYDSDADSLACVSCGSPGSGAGDSTLHEISGFATGGGGAQAPNTESPGHHFTIYRNLTDDGATLFFQSESGLVPADSNGRQDVYRYDVASGEVELISTGNSPADSYFLDATPDGRDAYIVTRERLLPSDIDDAYDVYDARVGGGFARHQEPPGCSGDECQGEPSGPPGSAEPGSSSLTGPGNVAAAAEGCQRLDREAKQAERNAKRAKRKLRRARKADNDARVKRLKKQKRRKARQARQARKQAEQCGQRRRKEAK